MNTIPLVTSTESIDHELKELFIDYNMQTFLDVHEKLDTYKDLGLFNKSISFEFTDIFLNNIYFNFEEDVEELESFSD